MVSEKGNGQKMKRPDALAERRVAKIGAVPLACEGNGTAPNRLSALIPCGACGSARPAYSRENQVRTLAGEPRIETAGPATVGAVAGPWITTPGLAPDAMTVWWNIAKLALRFHRQGRSPNMDWPRVTAFSEICRCP